jgi:hypothetical protein
LAGSIIDRSGDTMKVIFTYILSLFFLGTMAQQESDSLTVIRAWKLTNSYSTQESVGLDTNLPNFQIIYPIYDYSISNSFLGNYGSPAIQNIFADRIFNNDAFYINPYLPSITSSERNIYYDTKKPYSTLSYTNNGPNENREHALEALHTQNINPKFNFSLRYRGLSTKGQYRYLQLKRHAFQITTNYRGSRYLMHAGFNLARVRAAESGGIIDSVFQSGIINNSDVKEKDLPARFGGTNNPDYESNAWNRVRYYDITVAQRLKLLTIGGKVDTADQSKGQSIAEPVLNYVFRMTRATKTYDHINPLEGDFYDYTHFNPNHTLDSVSHFNISNILQLEFKTTFRRKVQVGIFGLIGNDYEIYSMRTEWDTSYSAGDSTLTIVYNENGDTLKGYSSRKPISNTYFSAGLYGNFWNKVKTRFTGTIYFLGYKAGQTRLDGTFLSDFTLFGKEFEIDGSVAIENNIPSYLFEHYYSNHYVWDQNLNPESRFILTGKIGAPSNKFELRGSYYLISGYFYFNEEGKPGNYDDPLNVFSIELAKTFKLWKIYSVNRIIYQASEKQEIIPLPNLAIYNSTYFDHTFNFKSTGGQLQAMLGFDLYYTTSFYGYEYSPALAQFHIQNFNDPGYRQIGNYPRMDVFFNLKLKSVRFFAKLQHFYSKWTQPRYYSAISYPYNRFALVFGVSWTFYN